MPPAIVILPSNGTLVACEHTSWLLPANTAGNGPNRTTTVSVEIAQSSLLADVKTSFTAPAALSAAVGKYCAFKSILDENVPVPSVDHTPVEVGTDMVPARRICGA